MTYLPFFGEIKKLSIGTTKRRKRKTKEMIRSPSPVLSSADWITDVRVPNKHKVPFCQPDYGSIKGCHLRQLEDLKVFFCTQTRWSCPLPIWRYGFAKGISCVNVTTDNNLTDQQIHRHRLTNRRTIPESRTVMQRHAVSNIGFRYFIIFFCKCSWGGIKTQPQL